MPHRAHLFSLSVGYAIKESFAEGYDRTCMQKDILAGITVGVIAMPLAMALAIASGVAPQYGLYTAIIAGFIIALTGGSRFSVSGPTAAFVVILYPIAQQYGHAGLLLATAMSGILLIIMAYARLGRLIEYIPESVTLGFTVGIGIVIATMQLNDFFGFAITEMPEHYAGKILLLVGSITHINGASLGVALFTLAIMLAWPRLKTRIPPHLPALILASLLTVWLNNRGYSVDTIASRFSYLLPDGSMEAGIPPYLPSFEWPWMQAGPDGNELELGWPLLSNLLPAAFAIAMLGAIESLLCAVVLDGMTGKRHSANSELLGQGLGNLIVPFFGGFTATAAIARSAANFKAGAQSPIAAMLHAIIVLVGLIFLAPYLAYLPMPAMAALLIVVAWNMSETPKATRLLKSAPTRDVAVFITCLLLTVLFDMVVAITAGVLLASVLFMQEIAGMTRVSDITDNPRLSGVAIPKSWKVFKIVGPLFFAAADRVFGELALQLDELDGVILHMDGVPLLDSGGLAAMNKLVDQCQQNGTEIYFADWQFQPLKTLARGGVKPVPGVTQYFPTLQDAFEQLEIGHQA